MEEKKNTLYPDEDEDEEEVNEEVTLIDSLGSVDARRKKKGCGPSPRSSLMKQSISDRPREKKTCRFLDNCDMEKRIESHCLPCGTKGHDSRRSTSSTSTTGGRGGVRGDLLSGEDEENEDEDDDEDAVAAVGKILIFKPRGQSKSVRRKKCFIRFISWTLALCLVIAIATICSKKHLRQNIAKSFHSFLGSTIDFTHSTYVDMSCDLNSSVVWLQSIPFIINPVIHVIHPPVYHLPHSTNTASASASPKIGASSESKSSSSQKKVLQEGQLIAVAFQTGIDAAFYPPETCDLYFPSGHKIRQTKISQVDSDLIQQSRFPWTFGCGGGVAAFDPLDGSLIWSILVKHSVRNILCNLDINNDDFNDCFVTGSNSLIMALDGKTGQIIWSIDIHDELVHKLSANLAPLVLSYDMDKDGKSDLLILNTGINQDFTEKIPAQLLFVSSVYGRVIKHLQFYLGSPSNSIVLHEDSMSPVQLIDSDGSATIILPGGSGNSLFAISLEELVEGRLSSSSATINDDPSAVNGHVTHQPIITNCNFDSIDDLIVPFNNGTLACFSGKDFSLLWRNNGQLPGEIIKSSPGVAKISPINLVIIVTRVKQNGGNDIQYLVDIKNGYTLNRIQMAHFDDHSDVHFEPGSPVTVSTVSTPDSVLLWSTYIKNDTNCTPPGSSVTSGSSSPSPSSSSSSPSPNVPHPKNIANSGRKLQQQMNCSSFGLLSMSLEANSNFKFKPLYDSIFWWKKEQEPAQKGFSTSELVAKWKSGLPNDQSVFLEPNLYDAYNVDGSDGMGNSDRSINLEDRRRRRKKRSQMERGTKDAEEDEDENGIRKRETRAQLARRSIITSSRGKRSTKSIEKYERGFSTASLIAKDNPSDGSDVIFGTWWQPMKTLETLSLPMDTFIEACIRRYSDPRTAESMKQSMKGIRQLMPSDYLQTVNKFCRERVYATQKHASPSSASSNTLYSQGSSFQDDLLTHKLGQFTLYRLNLSCKNGAKKGGGKKGPQIAPITGQIWPEANGWTGSSIVRTPNLYH